MRAGKPDFSKDKPYSREEKPERTSRKEFRSDKPFSREGRPDKPARKEFRREKPRYDEERTDRPAKRSFSRDKPYRESGNRKFGNRGRRPARSYRSEPEDVRLNKYIANSGICSRREADDLIRAGVIKVNGEVITALGSKVKPGDKIQYGDQTLSDEKKRYLLLNKQKGYVTTTKDPHAKNTVMELIAGACRERIYPVGRLDRNTTGLLLFTNDGEMAKKLMHPGSRIQKMYHVVLDQPLTRQDLLKIGQGIDLDDEHIEVDSIAYVEDAADRREVGMTVHSGQNRVIRRIFEMLGYKVTKLDRVLYAGLTKKNLPRGKWRFLNEKEVIQLKMMR